MMTTTAGEQWTNWPSAGGAPGWVAICKEMQNYLSGGGAETNLTVGATLTQTLDATRYGPVVTRGLAAWTAGYSAKAATATSETWAKHALMDWFACTIAGAREPLADILAAEFASSHFLFQLGTLLFQFFPGFLLC